MTDRAPVTLVRPDHTGITTPAFPDDLFEQSRGRIRLLAGFFCVAFGFDVLVGLGELVYSALTGHVPAEPPRAPAFQWISLGAALMSAGLWWAAGTRRLEAGRLHTIGLLYQVAICFTSAALTFWQHFLDRGLLPHLTWVPAIVIMFPLIMPGPPRRMLAAAIASAAMSPFAMLWLDLAGLIETGDGAPYVPATIGPLFGVVVAWLGARVIYGLGREVARARAMGSYQLEERLGVGGMGEVWRARHRMLARPAAIKLIREDAAGQSPAARAEMTSRFEQEARAIASLRSPHTVEIFDYGIASNGAFYYAMELLDGLDADALVRRHGPLPAERVVFILLQACHSLAEAGARGLVHRDIKPANLFLCRYGEDTDFVKILDFGIVKLHREPETGPQLSGTHSIRGTPAFMAPEQAMGMDLDGRADIYALGCVAWWLLTGRLVFEADNPRTMLLKHIQTPAAAPSTASELEVPAELDRIVLACLEKDRVKRPATARELSDRLAAVPLRAMWTEQRASEWWEGHMPGEAGRMKRD